MLTLSLSLLFVVSFACYFRVVVLCFAIVANEYLGQQSLNCVVLKGEGEAGWGNCQIVAKLVCKCSGRPKTGEAGFLVCGYHVWRIRNISQTTFQQVA